MRFEDIIRVTKQKLWLVYKWFTCQVVNVFYESVMVHCIIDGCGRMNNQKISMVVKHDNEKDRISIGLGILNYLYLKKNEKNC